MNGKRENGNGKGGKPKFSLSWIYILLFAAFAYIMLKDDGSEVSGKAGYTQFKEYVRNGYARQIKVFTNTGNLELYLIPDSAYHVFGENRGAKALNPMVTVGIGSLDNLMDFLDEAEAEGWFKGEVEYIEKSNMFTQFLWGTLPFILLIVFWIWMMRRVGGGGAGPQGGGIFSVGKSKARVYERGEAGRITFADVAGQSEAKEEVREIVDFLKNPKKYTDLGGKIPKGALLVGPPGTGKTLLAKAVAGEANVPFFTMSGSDFVEMFVGVGASRVRDLFQQAKEKAPCIIFIDEIDAVGRARGKNPAMGGNDERESTLNQLLTEMDGFGTNSGVIILAATNRADILDKALLRAGRFDRQIYLDLPNLNERKEVFMVHLKGLKLSPEVDVDLLARQTPGFSGADIANVCNEAALIAARHKKKSVEKEDFLAAVDRIVGGLEKKTKVLTAEEKETIALHESGHATLSWFLEYANPLIKVTIVPRGRALGAAWYLPEERQITTKEQMLDEMCATLGGRAAEELFTGHISTGAMNDLERVTKQAYGMIAFAGMSDRLANLCYYSSQDEYMFQKPYSEKTAEMIDQEVKALIDSQYERAKKILLEKAEGHHELAKVLLEREVIFAEDVERIFGKRPWASRSEEILSDTKPESAKIGEQAEKPVGTDSPEPETAEEREEKENEE
ncbi:MAG: ATP-dependent zinc metalloprotease FtsH [Bacteroidales bacterium]|nr:ATP-dependent zinc metalloprotease FtsH [Bacteroidales bacterium]